mgnify:CR=1 FL=1
MVQKFSGRPKADAIKVNMNLILDVPAEFAEQIELLGICLLYTSDAADD